MKRYIIIELINYIQLIRLSSLSYYCYRYIIRVIVVVVWCMYICMVSTVYSGHIHAPKVRYIVHRLFLYFLYLFIVYIHLLIIGCIPPLHFTRCSFKILHLSSHIYTFNTYNIIHTIHSYTHHPILYTSVYTCYVQILLLSLIKHVSVSIHV